MKYLTLGLPGGQTIDAPSNIPHGGINFVQTVFSNTYVVILMILTALCLIYIVLGAIQWITSGGDKTKLEAARKKLTYAIIGLIVAFMSFLIVSILGYVFGINILKIGG